MKSSSFGRKDILLKVKFRSIWLKKFLIIFQPPGPGELITKATIGSTMAKIMVKNSDFFTIGEFYAHRKFGRMAKPSYSYVEMQKNQNLFSLSPRNANRGSTRASSWIRVCFISCWSPPAPAHSTAARLSKYACIDHCSHINSQYVRNHQIISNWINFGQNSNIDLKWFGYWPPQAPPEVSSQIRSWDSHI